MWGGSANSNGWEVLTVLGARCQQCWVGGANNVVWVVLTMLGGRY